MVLVGPWLCNMQGARAPRAAKPSMTASSSSSPSSSKELQDYEQLLTELQPHLVRCKGGKKFYVKRRDLEASVSHKHLLKKLSKLENNKPKLYSQEMTELIEAVEKEIRKRRGTVGRADVMHQDEKEPRGDDEVAEETDAKSVGGQGDGQGEDSFQLEADFETPFSCIKNLHRHEAIYHLFSVDYPMKERFFTDLGSWGRGS